MLVGLSETMAPASNAALTTGKLVTSKSACDSDNPGRQVRIDEESHADSEAESSRSLTRAAANSSDALMSSASKYG